MTIIIFLIILAILILSHEFGHFIVAKKSGVRVDEFGLGFPPKLFGWKYGETEYSLNAIPFGGFVKIFGETPDEESLTGPEHQRSLISKSKFSQALVLVAGVVCNLLLAWLLLSIGFMIGLPTSVEELSSWDKATSSKLIITNVLPVSPAELSGLKSGDEIVSVVDSGGEFVNQDSIEDLQNFISSRPEEELVFNYRRGKVFTDSDLVVQTTTVKPVLGLVEDKVAIGIAMDHLVLAKKNFFLALWSGLALTAKLSYLTVVALSTLIVNTFQGEAILNTITGPVGLVGLVGDATSLGLVYLLSFTAFISINLAVINLVPFPALDGGRLLFLLIEKIKGSTINPAIANTLNLVGFALLLLLMFVITYNDIVKLI